MFPNGPNKYSTRAAAWAYTGLDQLERMGQLYCLGTTPAFAFVCTLSYHGCHGSKAWCSAVFSIANTAYFSSLGMAIEVRMRLGRTCLKHNSVVALYVKSPCPSVGE